MTSYLERYLAGETEQVWDEISPLVYADLDKMTQDDIKRVCQETMRRVRHNAEMLIKALESIGFKFGFYPNGNAFPSFAGAITAPDPKLSKKVAVIEAAIGSLPMALQTFWEEIGEICLIGHYPDWPEYADPLMVFGIEASTEELKDWQECVEYDGIEEVGPYRAVIAPDDYHKDDVSGGDWYGIELPCATVDGIITEEPHQTTLVNYLRIAFRAKGFPGCKELPKPYATLTLDLIVF